jgi:antirestriction protein ArdC
MPSQNDIRQSITNQIIAALESGSVPPWRRPWRLGKNSGAHANIVSRRTYKGLNPLLLDLASQTHGFSSRFWGTYRQWQELGGQVMARPPHVKPGAWACRICFWTPVQKTRQKDLGDDEEDRFFVLRLYGVFNIDQVIGSHLDHLRAAQADTTDSVVIDYQPADHAIEATGATIRYGGGKAFYSPISDYIQVPPKATFESLDEYYGTCFHELTHWSEHPTRLNWSRKDKENTYALGELVAEIGSCYLCRELGVPASDDLSNHIAYVGNWLQAMRSDPRFIFMASAQASKAADFILSFSRQPDEVPEPDGELVNS